LEGEVGEAAWEAGETGAEGGREGVGWVGEGVDGGGVVGFAFGFEFLDGEPARFDSAAGSGLSALRVRENLLSASSGDVAIPAEILVATAEGDDSQHADHVGFEGFEVVGCYRYCAEDDDSA
jgi:hypothetical protein